MQWPEVLDWLADGALTLASIPILAPHLTADNHASLLDSARHKSKRDVEHLVAVLHPQPDVPASIRRCPGTEQPADVLAAIAPPSPSPTRPVVAPLAQERYKVQFTVSRQTHDKLRRAQDLLRHTVPNGDPAEIFDRALTLLVTHLERTKLASVQRLRAPRPAVAVSRHIPASVRRAVWTRDGARCAFVGNQGRCAERGFLELHHVVPFAHGGAATVDNIQLRCRAHNQFEAEDVFGLWTARAGQ